LDENDEEPSRALRRFRTTSQGGDRTGIARPDGGCRFAALPFGGKERASP